MRHTSFLTLASLSFTTTIICTQGQIIGNTPVPVNGAAFVRSRTKLYVQGGVVSLNGNTVAQQNQLFALDLATAWDAASPTWIGLKQGPTQAMHTAAISTDENTLVTFRATSSASGSALSYRYHILSNSWDQSVVKVQNPTKEGVRAVQDPVSGLVYLAGGYQSDDSQMYVYNIDTDTMTMLSMPSNYMVDRLFYAGVYLKSRRSIIYFGGTANNNQSSQNVISEFTPSNGGWLTLNTSGQSPPHRVDHCMAASDDSSKVVVFGGRFDNGTFARDLWILDVSSLTWTQGDPWFEPRTATTCTVAGSIFLAWGGNNGQRTVDGTIVLYDLNSGQYISSYTPPSYYANGATNNGYGGSAGLPNDSPQSRPNGNGSNGNSSSNPMDDHKTTLSLMVIGGIIGTVLLIACVTLVSVFVRRHHQKIERQCISYAATSALKGPHKATPDRHSSANNLGSVTAANRSNLPRDGLSFDKEKFAAGGIQNHITPELSPAAARSSLNLVPR